MNWKTANNKDESVDVVNQPPHYKVGGIETIDYLQAKLSPEAKAKAQKELLQMQQEGKLAELNADNIEAQELTKRQEADMASDSWLSKNIRPMTLVFILLV